MASKELIERLNPNDARALELEPDRITYTTLHDLPGVSENARRDAPTIAVVDI